LKKQADEMERTYWSKKENSLVGKNVRKKLRMDGLLSGGITAEEDALAPEDKHSNMFG
jgi:hypothetical protein